MLISRLEIVCTSSIFLHFYTTMGLHVWYIFGLYICTVADDNVILLFRTRECVLRSRLLQTRSCATHTPVTSRFTEIPSPFLFTNDISCPRALAPKIYVTRASKIISYYMLFFIKKIITLQIILFSKFCANNWITRTKDVLLTWLKSFMRVVSRRSQV